MVKLALLLALAAAEAPRAPEPGAPAAQGMPGRSLDTFEAVRDYCEKLRQGQRETATVNVPSKAFNFGRYRKADRELELDGDRPLRAAEGTLVLDVQGIDDVAFRADSDMVAQLRKAKEAGEVTLQIALRPGDDGCRGSKFARQFRLGGSAESWRLVRGGKVVASADDEGKPVTRTDGGRGAKVTSVSLENEPAAEDEGRSRLQAAQRSLDECARMAKKPGSLVLSFSAGRGELRDVQVVVDGVRDAAVTGCIAQALKGAPIGGSGKGTATIAVE